METDKEALAEKSSDQPNNLFNPFLHVANLNIRTDKEAPAEKSGGQPNNVFNQFLYTPNLNMGTDKEAPADKSGGQPNNVFNQFLYTPKCQVPSINKNPDVEAVSKSNGQFTIDLYKVLCENSGNLFFSPISIHVILSLLYLGAEDLTARELRNALRLPDDDRVIKDGVNATMEQLEAASDVILHIANKIYLMSGMHLLDSFNEAAAKFMASVQDVNFGNGDEARHIINAWVEEKTHKRIGDVIPPGYFNSLTAVVLVNAVYFKGDWASKFNKQRTKKMPFYSTSTENVDMMYVKNSFKYADSYDLNSQVLLLPYKGNRFSMLIFLPRQVNGLLELETKLDNVDFHEVMTRMFRSEVNVYLPKFKMEYNKNLNGTLKKLGMSSIFVEGTMGLSGITGDSIKVDEVLHKSFIEVNEEGTEAAAATAVSGSLFGSAPYRQPPIVFKADHPFVFFIVDLQTITVLFAGRLSTPSSR